MYDKRELRRMNRDKFINAIEKWRSDNAGAKGMRPVTSTACQVFVRVRPMFDAESERGEFDVLTANSSSGEIFVHNCLFHSDLVRMHIHTMGYRFPSVFAPYVNNEEVYARCGSPLVAHAIGGNLSTLFMLGQTGSGKTHTIRGIIQPAMVELFASLESVSAPHAGGVSLRAFEIAGKHCADLLSSPNRHAELKLLADEDGHTQIVGATALNLSSAEDILAAIYDALASRKTTAHSRNAESSRSHCVLAIDLANGGSLILVDCAGTERRQDTGEHTPEQRREAAEINSSLHALKECIRFRGEELRHRDQDPSGQAGQLIRVPYRSSTLTRVLEGSFTRMNAKLCAIGTLAPASVDTEHTLTTLRTLQLLQDAAACSTDPCYDEKTEVRSTDIKQKVGTPSKRSRCASMPTIGRPLTASRTQLERKCLEQCSLPSGKPLTTIDSTKERVAECRAVPEPSCQSVRQDSSAGSNGSCSKNFNRKSVVPVKPFEHKTHQRRSPNSSTDRPSSASRSSLSSTKVRMTECDVDLEPLGQHIQDPFECVVRERFCQLDTNGDGLLDSWEVAPFLQSIDTGASQLRKWMAIDTNCDGKVDFDEFFEFVSANRHVAQLRSASTSADIPPQQSPAVGSAFAFARHKSASQQSSPMPKRRRSTSQASYSRPLPEWGSAASCSYGRDCITSADDPRLRHLLR
jgi:kinesin family protein 2/24